MMLGQEVEQLANSKRRQSLIPDPFHIFLNIHCTMLTVDLSTETLAAHCEGNRQWHRSAPRR